jgi:hypothetical protein
MGKIQYLLKCCCLVALGCVMTFSVAQTQTPRPAQDEVILPSTSWNVGIHAAYIDYDVNGVSENNIALFPRLYGAYYFNLNERITHAVALAADYAHTADDSFYNSKRYALDINYRASLLTKWVGIATGFGYKATIFNMYEAAPDEEIWLTQFYLPLDLYWVKQLPSNDAILLQAGLPLMQVISAPFVDTLSEGPHFFDSQIKQMHSNPAFGLPFSDYYSFKASAAYGISIDRTKVLKLGYQVSYFQLKQPYYQILEHGIAIVYQF